MPCGALKNREDTFTISGGGALEQPEYFIFGVKGSLVCSGNTIDLKYLDPFNPLSDITASPDAPPTRAEFPVKPDETLAAVTIFA